MIDGLRLYPEMKPTGLPWLGDVPAHWDVRRIKTLLKEVDYRSKSGEERLLSLRMRQGLVDHIDSGGKLIPAEFLVGFKIVEPGQVVMNRMRAAAGLFGVANVRGLVSPDYAVFEPKPDAHNPYLLQAFRLPSLAAVFRAESKGLGTGESGFLRLYTDRFGPIPVPHPPPDEQRLIVRFLDWHGVQTAKLIRAKKKLIALLNEQKQAIIHRVVTRSLDPNVNLKPSGIPWLGDVPQGWAVLPPKRIIQSRSAGAAPIKNTASIVELTGHVPAFSASGQDIWLPEARFCGPGLVLSAVGARCGKTFKADGAWAVAANTHVLLVPASQSRDFWWYVTNLANWWERAGAAQPFVQVARTLAKPWAFPQLSEQLEIVAYIEGASSEINAAIEAANRVIALLHEFRTRLIADVVTGKLDVRAAAASLAEIIEEERVDEAADGEDLDKEIEDTENEEVAA